MIKQYNKNLNSIKKFHSKNNKKKAQGLIDSFSGFSKNLFIIKINLHFLISLLLLVDYYKLSFNKFNFCSFYKNYEINIK
jgi:hypothetical protein